MNDTTKQQFNYLIPESVTIGKSSSYIVSMLDEYFVKHALGETTLILHADNCCWQNKNFTMLSYLNYRILKNLNTTIELHFMPPGHTKFSCDWAFGLFKQKFRRSRAYTVEQVANIVQESTPISGINKSVPISDERGLQLFIPFRKWTEYFEKLNFKRVTNVSTYYHFTFTNEKPGYVFCRKTLDDTCTVVKIGDTISSETILEEDMSTGLPKARQKYLFDHIREYCAPEYRDQLCPPVECSDSDCDAMDNPAPPPKRGKSAQQNSSNFLKKCGRPRKNQ